MQLGVELNEPFHYSLLPLIFFVVLLEILIVVYLRLNRKPKKEKIVIMKASNPKEVKDKYLDEIQKLLDEVNKKNITNRVAFEKVSFIIRSFINEMIGIDVLKCTLSEIKYLNIPMLYELVKEYYEPEFSKFSIGDIVSSINKTKEVILKW